MKKIFVSGNFNILHPGHVRLLRFARELGDQLIVGVNSDKIAGNNSHINEKFRLEGIKSNNWVTRAFLIKEPLEKTIKKIKPDIIVKGKEYQNQDNLEKKILDKYGGRLIFTSGEVSFSSYDLINKEIQRSETKLFNLPKKYLMRHKIKKIQLIKIIKNMKKLKIIVIGDLIIDKYIFCEPLGMSQEDPSIVVKPIEEEMFVGGAGIVSSHASSIGAKVNFFSISGNDIYRKFALKKLSSYGVKSNLYIDDSRPTTVKTRYKSNNQTVLRVSNLTQISIPKNIQNRIFKDIKKIISQSDLLVFSDFNYGCLPQTLVDKIINLCSSKKVLMVADSQSSSQNGNICRFKNMTLITPTEREGRVATRNQEDGLVILAEELHQQSKAGNSILKLGQEGIMINKKRVNPKDYHTDKISALNSSARDVMGAGDSLLISSAMTLAMRGNIWEAAIIGSIASAIQVSKVGNIPLTANEILKQIK